MDQIAALRPPQLNFEFAEVLFITPLKIGLALGAVVVLHRLLDIEYSQIVLDAAQLGYHPGLQRGFPAILLFGVFRLGVAQQHRHHRFARLVGHGTAKPVVAVIGRQVELPVHVFQRHIDLR